MTYVRGDWRDHYGRQAEGRTRPALQQLGYAAFFTLGIPRAPASAATAPTWTPRWSAGGGWCWWT